jgi:uncharacterized Zn-binding protein involved in type VI secretion
MAGVVRLGDLSAGLEGDEVWPKTAVVTPNNSTVYANGKLVATQGGSFATHIKGRVTHLEDPQRKIKGGSNVVFVENKPVARSGDSIEDTDTCDECSPNVFAG